MSWFRKPDETLEDVEILEDEQPVDDPEDETIAPTPVAEIDYDRIISGVAERLRPQQQEKETDEPATDSPYESIAANLWDKPEAAIAQIIQIAREEGAKDALKATEEKYGQRFNHVDTIAARDAFESATRGMDDSERGMAAKFLETEQIDPLFLQNPTFAKLVRSHVELESFRTKGKLNEQPVPGTEGVVTFGNLNLDPATQGTLASMKKAYEANGMKFDAQKILKRAGR